MASIPSKHYPVDGLDSRQLLEHYFSDNADMVFGDDSLLFPLQNITKTFSEGHIKGDVLIDVSVGPVAHHLYAVCGFFKHILVLKVQNRCIMEMKRWLDSRTGAFNWGHVLTPLKQLEGKSDSLEDKDGKVRSATRHVMRCNLRKENITDPIVLPPADCITSVWLLGAISKNQDDYIGYLKRFSDMLKPGGHLILIGALGITYYTVGKDKLCAFSYDEAFVRKALDLADFVIDSCEVKERTNVSDIIDYQGLIFIVARRRR